MFGKNPILGKDYKNHGDSLHIVKGNPFLTIQGEGPYSGHRAYFLRLHGCMLRCHFCDTNFSDPEDPIISTVELVAKLTAPGTPTLIVVTGGEPMRQDIRPLCATLHESGKTVQIETAGVYWLDGLEKVAEIVCSPKTPKIHPKIFQYASTFKYVIDCNQQFDRFIPITATQPGTNPQRLAEPRDGALIYLSPMDCYDAARNMANRSKVAELAMKYDCIAGLQLHKFMGLD
jgi:7-carboxy-7-deazaguanine synthase